MEKNCKQENRSAKHTSFPTFANFPRKKKQQNFKNDKKSWHILIFATQGYTCKTMSKGVCDGINTKPIFVVKDYTKHHNHCKIIYKTLMIENTAPTVILQRKMFIYISV